MQISVCALKNRLYCKTCTDMEERHERNYFSRRKRNKAVSIDQGNIQAASADLWQADDLLSAFRVNECRNPGYFNYLHSGWYAEVWGTFRWRKPVRHPLILCRSAKSGRSGAGVYYRWGIYRKWFGCHDFGR